MSVTVVATHHAVHHPAEFGSHRPRSKRPMPSLANQGRRGEGGWGEGRKKKKNGWKNSTRARQRVEVKARTTSSSTDNGTVSSRLACVNCAAVFCLSTPKKNNDWALHAILNGKLKENSVHRPRIGNQNVSTRMRKTYRGTLSFVPLAHQLQAGHVRSVNPQRLTRGIMEGGKYIGIQQRWGVRAWVRYTQRTLG